MYRVLFDVGTGRGRRPLRHRESTRVGGGDEGERWVNRRVGNVRRSRFPKKELMVETVSSKRGSSSDVSVVGRIKKYYCRF